ncbi:hypothetical protein F5887DRAFT_999630 [Amanita rubescens]|nr:hypothetical protein F5887DRAFT_999630 [Amanita rubescens]
MRSTHLIPAETIHEIFSHLYESPLRVHEAHQFPWYLGQICSQWRAVFLSTRLLFWNEIQIESASHAEESERDATVARPTNLRLHDSDSETDTDQSEDWQPDASRTMAMLTFFLDITRGTPFSFTLYSEQSYHTTDIEIQYVRLVLSKLSDYSMQWKNVAMKLQFSEFMLLRNVKNRLQSLQCLELVLPHHSETERSESNDPLLGDIFEDAPLLTNIKLCRLSDMAWTFNWASLTTIRILTSDDPEDIVSVLRHTTNLEKFTINYMRFPLNSVNAAKSGIIKLPYLEYLSIQGVSLLTVIQAPALKFLGINFWNQYSDGPHSLEEGDGAFKARVTMDFLLRSHCKVAAFFSRGLKSSALVEILSYMPDLHRFASDDECEFLIGMVKWLAGSQSSTDATQPHDLPLPRLVSLAFFRTFLFSASSSVHTFLEALQDRIAGRNVLGDTKDLSPLKALRLHRRPGLKNVLDRLESLCRERGVQLTYIDNLSMDFDYASRSI